MSAVRWRQKTPRGVPELLAGVGAGTLVAALAGAFGAPGGLAGVVGPIVVAGAPLALAALVGVAKSSTP